MNSQLQSDSGRHTRTALVLGGGGSTGNAWLIGVISGLLDAGLDVTDADLIIGTSAGSTAAAQLTSATPGELFAMTLAVPPRQTGGSPQAGGRAAGLVVDHLERFRSIIAASDDAADMRRRMGAAALEQAAVADRSEAWRATVAARFSSRDWPLHRMLITAVDASTGEPVVFDRDSGVDLVDAVAASTSGGGSAFRIGDRSFIDGGYRSNAENADLAAGYERVLVLSPLGGRSLYPAEWGTHLAMQVDELRSGGSDVETMVPPSSAEHMFGANAMEFALRPAAAQVGYEQGSARAEKLIDFWQLSR